MKAINIKWDTDGDMEVLEQLPIEIELPNGMTDEEEISDYISDETGFCHYGFELEYGNNVSESIKNIIRIYNALSKELGELMVEMDNGEQYHIIYYVDEDDEWHFFYEDGKTPDYIDFEHELLCSM